MEQLRTFHGTESGPCLFVIAGIHGDEHGAVATALALIEYVEKQPLIRGSLHVLPQANPVALAAGTRIMPESGEDLNRSFPGLPAGSPTGSPAAILAYTLLQNIEALTPTLVLDLHNDWRGSTPYCLLDPCEGEARTSARAVALALGCAVVQEQEALPSTLSGYLVAHNTPALTVELGGSEEDPQKQIPLLLRALAHLGMAPAPTQGPVLPEELRVVLNYAEEKTKDGGTLHALITPGTVVAAGTVLATVGTEELRASARALVLGFNDRPSLTAGDTALALGLTQAHVQRT